MQGAITLILDDNKRVVLHPGDVIVQRGTIHAWKNEGTEWTKVYFIVFRKSTRIALVYINAGSTNTLMSYFPSLPRHFNFLASW